MPTTTPRYVAIDSAEATRYRETLHDDHGNALAPATFGEGEVAPCRVCLHMAGAGERMLLLAYRPFTTRGPYAEIGPIFIHADGCTPHAAGFPKAFCSRTLTLRAYDRAGTIACATVAEPGAAEAWIAVTLGDSEIACVHARHVSYGCFDFLAVRETSA